MVLEYSPSLAGRSPQRGRVGEGVAYRAFRRNADNIAGFPPTRFPFVATHHDSRSVTLDNPDFVRMRFFAGHRLAGWHVARHPVRQLT